MIPAANIFPVPYGPNTEVLEEDEAETIANMKETMHGIQTKMLEDTNHATRAVHAKTNGMFIGKLTVIDQLPSAYAQGLFAQHGTYDAVLRLSAPPSEVLDDHVSTPRALALKIIDVPGSRVDGSETEATQDFMMVNGPVFNTSTAKAFLMNMKMLSATTDKAPRAKEILSAVLRGAEKAIEAVGGESGFLKSMGGHPPTNPLGETYFSQTPYLYGTNMAKFSLAPVSPGLLALKDAEVELKDGPDALLNAVSAHFAREGGEWELRVQLCVDIDKMPIEDPKVEWPEELSPFVPVARLQIQPQPAFTKEKFEAINERLQFNVWHALAAHRPIGSVNRVRKQVYIMSREFRADHNRVQIVEPRNLENLLDSHSTTTNT